MKNFANNLKITRRRPFLSVMSVMSVMAVLLLFFGAPQGPASAFAGLYDATLAFDGFESNTFTGGDGWLDRWDNQGRVVRLKMNPYEGTRYVKIMGGPTPGYLERAVDLSNVSSARLQFAGRVRSFEKQDKAYVKVSPDGVNYTVVAEFTPTDSDNVWHLHDIDLSAFEMSADFRIVFEGAMSRRINDKWYLDNIEILGSGEEPPPPPVEELLEQCSTGGDKMDIKEGQRGSQSFKYGVNGDPDYQITKIVLNLSREPDAPDGDFEFSIGTEVNAGDIAGSAVDISASLITDTSGGSTFMTYEVEFASPVGPLSAGATYYLNFENNAPNGKTYYLEFAGDDFYANGTYFKEFSNEQKDAWFQIWGGSTTGGVVYNLDVYSSGQGDIQLSPSGGAYPAGTQVQLTAMPATGWVFDHWEGDVSGSANPAALTMDSDKTATAVFIETVSYSLATSSIGQGDISLDPSGGTYTGGTEVQLTAEPATGWVFDHWEGDVSGSANPAALTMDSDKTATAVFIETVSFSLAATSNGQGSVSLNPAGGSYTEGAVVTLTANPASGWEFSGWSGDLSGTQNPATIVMDGDKNVEAAFVETTTTSWKFIIYGDTRSNDSAHRSVLRSMVNNTPDYRFMINVGDVVDEGSSTSQWNTWQRAVDDVLGGSGQNNVPPKYMACIGNHDTSGMTNWKNFLPGQYEQFGNDGKFFTFDYENARFVVLNSEQSLSGTQLTMLNNAINNNPKTWLFTVWHAPIFPFGQKSYESGIHNTWGVPLYNGGADIMFMGHAHYYVRSSKLELDGSTHPPIDNVNGTVQVVTGVGGAPRYSVSPNGDGNGYMVEAYNNSYGYTELTVEGDTLTYKQILANGTVFDTTTYTANPKTRVGDYLFDSMAAEISQSDAEEKEEEEEVD